MKGIVLSGIVNNYLSNILCKFLVKLFESTCRREIKEQIPQLTLLYCGTTSPVVFYKKLFLKGSQYPQETSVLHSLFKTVI